MKWWVYLQDEVSKKPYSKEELSETNGFSENTRVCLDGTEDWYKAGEVEELKPIFENARKILAV